MMAQLSIFNSNAFVYQSSVFQYSIIKEYFKQQEKIIKENYEKFKTIFFNEEFQNNLRNTNEEKIKHTFIRKLFCDCLGYTLFPEPAHNIELEYKNEDDQRKADAVIFVNANPVAVIELKRHKKNIKAKDVIDQAFSYKNHHRGVKYVIISNFQKLHFYIDNAVDCIEYDLFDLSEEQFAEMYLCLAYNNLTTHLVKEIKQNSKKHEDKITKDFYRDYKAFRDDLFENIKKYNEKLNYNNLTFFLKSIKLINRFLFVFFAQARELLRPNTIQDEIVGKWEQQKNNLYIRNALSLYDCVKIYFECLNVGHRDESNFIFGYNGGLFEKDDVLDNIAITDDIIKGHLEIIAKYDFKSEVDVNILGRIFETSLNYIDEIRSEIEGGKIFSTRKNEGIFYTPKPITNYIIKNAIGEMCENKKNELCINSEDYYYDNYKSYDDKNINNKNINNKNITKPVKAELIDKLEKYRNWLKEITICDPAVGSGAFLNAALTFLINEHNQINALHQRIDKNYTPEDIENYILENNLYGVDIKEESIEIAKLSLWLRTLKYHHKLSSMNNNVRCGNSLVGEDLFDADKPKYEKAFYWDKEFPHIFEKGGFDVVIGNPPYGAKTTDTDKDFFTSNYKATKTIKGTQKGAYDTYILFLEKAHSLVKTGGIVNMIVNMSVGTSDSSTALHNILFETCSYMQISNYMDRPVQIFPEAHTRTSIIKFKKDNKECKELLTTQMNRWDGKNDLDVLFDNLEFVNSYDYKLFGRFPKVSKDIEISILKKLFNNTNVPISELIDDENGLPIYYRSVMGYFIVVSNVSTGSTIEKSIYLDKKNANSIGAILSSSLFWWYMQVYSDSFHLKFYEVENFTIPVSKLTDKTIEKIEKLYEEYLKDIERNANVRTSGETSSYNVDSFKEYKIVYSKKLIDKIDDIICPLYGLTKEETEFIKNYELTFRMRGEK